MLTTLLSWLLLQGAVLFGYFLRGWADKGKRERPPGNPNSSEVPELLIFELNRKAA